MTLVLETLYLLLAFLDLEFTKRKIAEFGLEVELNPAIKWLVGKLGVSWGTFLGVVPPTLAFAALGWAHPHVLSFMLGFRSCLFLLQLIATKS